jgi:hypothetical protein
MDTQSQAIIQAQKIHGEAQTAEIERLKAQHEEFLLKHEKETNVLLTSLEQTAAEIERLKARLEEVKALITEMADALEEEFGESRDLMQSQKRPWNLIKRAREATR